MNTKTFVREAVSWAFHILLVCAMLAGTPIFDWLWRVVPSR